MRLGLRYIGFILALCTAPLCAAYADDPILLPPAKAAFVPVELAGHVGGLEPVLSVTIGSETKAYPLRILAFHGVINDVVAGTPLALSYCGPCGTVGAFKRAPEMFLEAIYDRDKTSMMLINKAGAKWAQKSGDGANTKKGAPRMLSAVPSQVVSMARVRQSATGDQVVLVLQDTAVSRVPTPKTLALPGNLAGTRGSDEDTGAVGANQTKVLDARSWSLDLLSPERRLGNEERLILLERKPAVQAGPPAP